MKFENRNAYTFKRRKPRSTRKYTMYKCECEKSFKYREGKICPSCGKNADVSKAIFIDERESVPVAWEYHLWDDGPKVGLAIMAKFVTRHPEYGITSAEPYPYRLKLSFKKESRQVFVVKDDLEEKRRLKIGNRTFLNISNPSEGFAFFETRGMFLSKDILDKLFNCLNMGENIYDRLSICDFIWMFRTGKSKEEAREIGSVFGSLKQGSYDLYSSEINREKAKKVFNMYKRYIKTGHKVKNHDKMLFEYFVPLHETFVPSTSEKKILSKHPSSMGIYKHMRELFKNNEILKNALISLSASEMDLTNFERMLLNTIEPHFTSYSNSRLDQFSNGKTTTVSIVEVFGGEKNLYTKIYNEIKKGIKDPAWLFKDTARMVYEIRQAGYKFKTKGSLTDLHDKASRLDRVINTPKGLEFNVEIEGKRLREINIGGFEFIPETLSDGLINLGYQMDICVASYWRYCQSNEISIVGVYKKGKPVGCLEVNKNQKSIVQAKSIHNMHLNGLVQKKVIEWASANNLFVDTRDISVQHDMQSKQQSNDPYVLELLDDPDYAFLA